MGSYRSVPQSGERAGAPDDYGPEILEQTRGRIGAFVASAGTGGTITGVARALKGASSAAQIVLADPIGSALAAWVHTGQPGADGAYAVEGIGASVPPQLLDRTLIDAVQSVSDAASFAMCRRLLSEEGLLVGGSAGTAVVAALRIAVSGLVSDPVMVLLPIRGTATDLATGCELAESLFEPPRGIDDKSLIDRRRIVAPRRAIVADRGRSLSRGRDRWRSSEIVVCRRQKICRQISRGTPERFAAKLPGRLTRKSLRGSGRQSCLAHLPANHSDPLAGKMRLANLGAGRKFWS